ncbi:S-layer homology domain-containing protein [Paenibacillus sp.]|uniref:S-layer homology domain-containing protein n=1 Tax=Paenibacillus sp. TaxID=58172 RepID=UPI002811285D|nr:S-layer homology domain-containing protein [Paenibacillus sp.]
MRSSIKLLLAISVLSAGIYSGAAVPEAEAAVHYRDVKSEAAWALAPVAELVQRGILTGYDDGSFRPNQTVSRIETITGIVRMMGKQDQAAQAAATAKDLQSSDAKLIFEKYEWAVGYIAVAEKSGLFEEDAVNPAAGAERWWTTMALVRAMGLEREAKRSMNTELEFNDSSDIPAEAVGYVAVALEKGLATGYDDDTFRPKRKVSRAEFAALLDRAGNIVPIATSDHVELTATVSAVQGNLVTLTKDGGTNTFDVGQDATIVREGELVGLGSIRAGDQVSAVLRGMKLVHMNVDEAALDASKEDRGVIASLSPSLIAIEANGIVTPYPVADTVTILRNALPADWNALKVGDDVTVALTGGSVARIEASSAVALNGRATGVVSSVTPTQIAITENGLTTAYPVSRDSIVVLNNSIGAWSDVQPGDQVTALISNNEVYHVSLTKTAAVSGESTGFVIAVYGKQIAIASNGQTTVYPYDDRINVVRAGKTAAIADIKPGDEVRLSLVDRNIILLFVTTPVDEKPYYTIEGTYQSHLEFNGSVTEITISVVQGGVPIPRTYKVKSDANVLIETGITNKPNFLVNYTKVELTVANNEVALVVKK